MAAAAEMVCVMLTVFRRKKKMLDRSMCVAKREIRAVGLFILSIFQYNFI